MERFLWEASHLSCVPRTHTSRGCERPSFRPSGPGPLELLFLSWDRSNWADSASVHTVARGERFESSLRERIPFQLRVWAGQGDGHHGNSRTAPSGNSGAACLIPAWSVSCRCPRWICKRRTPGGRRLLVTSGGSILQREAMHRLYAAGRHIYPVILTPACRKGSPVSSHRWANRGSEKVSHLLKVTQLVM